MKLLSLHLWVAELTSSDALGVESNLKGPSAHFFVESIIIIEKMIILTT